MYQRDTEMLFPGRVIPSLRDLRGRGWRQLVDRVAEQADADPDSLAFSLMMVRLGGCLTCQSDGYRAMRGCTVCARQTIVHFKDGDEALTRLFRQASKDVVIYLELGTRVDE